MRETQVGDGVFVWSLGGDSLATSYGANCTAVIGRQSVLLVDSLIAPAHARAVEEALAKKTGLPVRFVVLTHHHTDHALGSSWFAERGATVIAHPACRDAMAAEHPGLVESRRRQPEVAELFADAVSTPPSLCFEAELEIDLGGVTVRVSHPGHGHTSGDAVMFLPRESVLVTGDLVSHSYHVNYEDADLSNLEAGLVALESLGAKSCVPGHGAVAGAEILAAQRRYHREVERVVREAGDAKAAEAELKKIYPGYKLEILLPDTVRRWAGR